MSDLDALRRALRERTAELALEQAARLRAEEALTHTQHLDHVGRITAGIAHDLNNLLLVALMHADTLADPGLSAEERRSEALQLQAVLSRAGNLTTRVMAVARADDGAVRDLDPAAVLQEIVPLIRRLVGARVTLQVETDSGLWPIRADTMQLEQVLMNLASNARDAMPEGGTLFVTARNRALDQQALRREFDPPPGDYLEIALRDTGVGIAEDVRRRLFEPFFTTKPVGRGTGLGLVSSLGLVRRAGGTIMVDSEPGNGSTFRVLLPRAKVSASWPMIDRPLLAR